MVCSLCLLADLIPVLKTVYLKNSIVPDQTASKKAADRDPHCVCLFDLILYVPSTLFLLNRDGSI